jgi:coenzyme PQQ precursor peptide PqqA
MASVVGSIPGPDWVKTPNCPNHFREHSMTWTKPEAEIVAVTMEVTAYVATL